MGNIYFEIRDRSVFAASISANTIILTWEDWNDFSYYTLFKVDFINATGGTVKLGSVRIGYYGQKIGISERKLKNNDRFLKLADNYFSLGSEDTYYENLNNLGEELKDQILIGLNDIAFDKDIYEKAIEEEVTLTSLMRDISFNTVTTQYRRIAEGGARLTNYSFSFYFRQDKVATHPEKIDFNILAGHNPPTNIQIIIGRNGVGKSHLLNEMIDSLMINEADENQSGKFVFDQLQSDSFSNLICVTFSAFDEFQFHNKNLSTKIKYHYIGLKNLQKIKELESDRGSGNFADEFTSSLGLIISSSKTSRWKAVLKQLESDPIFKDENFIDLIDNYRSTDLQPIKERFAALSSGHKIILLTITKLVELLQEKSLVFFDEPETHLHPPLLSSLIRALSLLLTNRNAVCIMTTHSPIVLQEVAKSCVYKLSRKGAIAKFERVELETFGENISVLTNEIFGLEVTESGFYSLLKELVNKNEIYDEALQDIHQQLGIEGKAILRSLFFDKNRPNEAN